MKAQAKPVRWIPWRSMLAVVGVVLYFIMPFDLIPDVFWVVGFLDDATLAALALRWVLKDYRNYLARRNPATAAPEQPKEDA